MQIKFSLLLLALALVATTTVKACDVCEDDAADVAPGGADGGAGGTGAGNGGADGGAGAGGGGAGTGGAGGAVGNEAAGGAGGKADIIGKLQADIALLKVACPAKDAGAVNNNAADPAANTAAATDAGGNGAAANGAAADGAAANGAAANGAAADGAAANGAAANGAAANGAAANGAAANGAAGSVVKGGPVGQCPEPPVMELIAGLPGRKANEFTFNVQNTIPEFQKQGEALAPGIIVNFFCDRLKTSCKDDAAEQKCQAFKGTIGASKNGKVADDFNALFGTKSNFAALGDSGQQEVAPAAGGAGAAGGGAGAAGGAAGAAQDFSKGGPIGECTESPSIELIKGAAGRDPNEFVFQAGPNPIAAFSGQSVALNPKIIVDFLCNKLNDTCKDKAAQKVCTDFSATVKGKNGKVADDFNALFGKQTNFAAVGDSGKQQA